MKTKPIINSMSLSDEEFSARIREGFKKFEALPRAKKRAEMIKLGWLTPEGKVPVYPMDHVPYGPRY